MLTSQLFNLLNFYTVNSLSCSPMLELITLNYESTPLPEEEEEEDAMEE
jgi:hypothetical protein